ncbi:MAG TPA: hypothetical protein VL098_06740 [Flavipsychrobacter sp.]|nr:hypothetical protein [Flavipsychrobacter sp.]
MLLVLAAMTLSSSAFAQDVIYTKKGRIEKSKIKEIGVKTVTYKRWDNPDGPDFVMPKAEIRSIRFENGSEERFVEDEQLSPVRKKTVENLQYGKNILSLAPIWMTNTSPIGLALSYERVFGKEGIWSFILPVAYSFSSQAAYSSSGDNRKSTLLWAYPGAKFYIAKRQDGKAAFALGIGFPIGMGSIEEDRMIFDPVTQTSAYTHLENDISLLGVMMQPSLNIQPTEKIALAIDFGLGFPYTVKQSLSTANNLGMNVPYSNGTPLVNFGFKIGYRF